MLCSATLYDGRLWVEIKTENSTLVLTKSKRLLYSCGDTSFCGLRIAIIRLINIIFNMLSGMFHQNLLIGYMQNRLRYHESYD